MRDLTRTQHRGGMGIEREGHGRAIKRAGCGLSCAKNGLMPQMNSVKHTRCQNNEIPDFPQLVDGMQDSHQAPRSRDTAGRLKTRWATASSGPALSSSMVMAPSTLKRPDLVRRRALRWAPQPSSAPISCA